MRRGLVLSVLCLSLPAVLAARQSDTGGATKPWERFLGTWKEVPRPDGPTTLRVETEGAGVKYSNNCKQDGSCADVYVFNYDGRPYKDAVVPNWTASFRKTGDRTMEQNDFSSGKLLERVKWQLSPDGRMLTRTYHIVTPPVSRDFNFAYDRSGEPTSKDDPFIGLWLRNWDKSDAFLMTYALRGDALTISTSDGVSIERNCDGRSRPDYLDATTLYSCRFNDPKTYELVIKKNEKAIRSLVRKISDDGKKMVSLRKNAEGNTVAETDYEKVQ